MVKGSQSGNSWHQVKLRSCMEVRSVQTKRRQSLMTSLTTKWWPASGSLKNSGYRLILRGTWTSSVMQLLHLSCSPKWELSTWSSPGCHMTCKKTGKNILSLNLFGSLKCWQANLNQYSYIKRLVITQHLGSTVFLMVAMRWRVNNEIFPMLKC